MEVVQEIAPDRVFTTGPDGYDGHTDHIAVHDAAVASTAVLRRLGYETVLWALASDHQGELQVTGEFARKAGAVMMHGSQVVAKLPHWGGTELYTPLIIGAETYQAVPGFDMIEA